MKNSKINVFIPKNNDLKKTIFDVDVKNFDISPLRIYFKEVLPKDLNELAGFINVHANKGELHTELKKCGIYFNDSVKVNTDVVDKVRELKKYIDENGIDIDIEVDGGINGETAELAKEAGANILVAGNYLITAENLKEAVQSLK